MKRLTWKPLCKERLFNDRQSPPTQINGLSVWNLIFKDKDGVVVALVCQATTARQDKEPWSHIKELLTSSVWWLLLLHFLKGNFGDATQNASCMKTRFPAKSQKNDFLALHESLLWDYMLQGHMLSMKASALHTNWATGSETGMLPILSLHIYTAPVFCILPRHCFLQEQAYSCPLQHQKGNVV